jgi:hypothetical protein
LRTVLEDLLLEVMFEIPGRPEIVKCIVSCETLDPEGRPVLLDKTGAEVDYHGVRPVVEVEDDAKTVADGSEELEQESA